MRTALQALVITALFLTYANAEELCRYTVIAGPTHSFDSSYENSPTNQRYNIDLAKERVDGTGHPGDLTIGDQRYGIYYAGIYFLAYELGVKPSDNGIYYLDDFAKMAGKSFEFACGDYYRSLDVLVDFYRAKREAAFAKMRKITEAALAKDENPDFSAFNPVLVNSFIKNVLMAKQTR